MTSEKATQGDDALFCLCPLQGTHGASKTCHTSEINTHLKYSLLEPDVVEYICDCTTAETEGSLPEATLGFK